MTPNEMRENKAREITKIAQDLGWEALVEIEGYEFTAYLSAKNATEQMVEGKLSKAPKLLDEFGGPELYSVTETYDLIPLGVKDEAAELDEFVEGAEEVETPERDAGQENDEEDAADAMCQECDGGSCGIHEDVHDDPESEGPVNFHGYSPKELSTACEIDDQDRGGIPHPNQLKEVTVKTEGYVKTATRIIAEKGFVVVARPRPTDQAEGFKVQRFASLNLSHARALRNKYGYSIGIAAQ